MSKISRQYYDKVVIELVDAKETILNLKNDNVKMLELLTKLRLDSSLWKASKAGGQDSYAGLPPAMRLIDEMIIKF